MNTQSLLLVLLFVITNALLFEIAYKYLFVRELPLEEE